MKITTFENKELGTVRSTIIGGVPYFVGKDVANILGYQNGSRDINRHVDEEDRCKAMISDGNQDKETIVINESGLYSLVLSSKMPNAKKFKKWITGEVIPSMVECLKKETCAGELIKINYETEQPTVSARDLHDGLEIETPFKKWIDRMCEYGFEAGKDFWTKMSESTGGRPSTEYKLTIDMAKQICMLQRSDKGKQYRQYFLDLEKAWNTPEQIMARALKMADKTIESLKHDKRILLEENIRMKPKEIFADAVAVSNTCILVGDLAKILKQNGINIGQKRLFDWLRDNGYLIKRKGSDWNMPTQKSMNMKLFEIRESTTNNPDGSVRINRTTKVTGIGQQYFINKFLSKDRRSA